MLVERERLKKASCEGMGPRTGGEEGVKYGGSNGKSIVGALILSISFLKFVAMFWVLH